MREWSDVPGESEETDEGVPGMNRTLLRAVLVGYGGGSSSVSQHQHAAPSM